MSAVAVETDTKSKRPVRANREFKMFGRKLGSMVATLINDYGVRHRQPDGSHILLYSNEKGVRPYKISASRPEETSLRFLERWIKKNVPEYHAPEPETETAPAAELASVPDPLPAYVNDAKPKPEEEKEPEREWVVFYKGKETERRSEHLYWDRTVEPNLIRCTEDEYTSTSMQGVHLHENAHTGGREITQVKGAEERRKRRAERRQSIEGALRVLAGAHGLTIGSASEKQIEKMRTENERLKAQVDALTHERDELHAKLQLVREATGL